MRSLRDGADPDTMIPEDPSDEFDLLTLLGGRHRRTTRCRVYQPPTLFASDRAFVDEALDAAFDDPLDSLDIRTEEHDPELSRSPAARPRPPPRGTARRATSPNRRSPNGSGSPADTSSPNEQLAPRPRVDRFELARGRLPLTAPPAHRLAGRQGARASAATRHRSSRPT